MATWQEIGRDSFQAAHELLEQGRFRSSVSRAYFGLYSLVTAQLGDRGLTLSQAERDNPGHQQVLTMLEHNLISRDTRPALKRQITRASRTVQRARVVADYGPGLTVDQSLARAVLRDAHFVARQIGSEDV